jgi:hypothetical protein
MGVKPNLNLFKYAVPKLGTAIKAGNRPMVKKAFALIFFFTIHNASAMLVNPLMVIGKNPARDFYIKMLVWLPSFTPAKGNTRTANDIGAFYLKPGQPGTIRSCVVKRALYPRQCKPYNKAPPMAHLGTVFTIF